MRLVSTLFVVVLVGAMPAVGAGVGTGGNDPPVVDAGLDQRVQRGGAALLDATASRDPDGRIESVAWRVEAPDGTTVDPACATCERTSFETDQLGTYRVTLAATDSDGATESDRLEVTVVPEPRPAVRLSGPATVDRGERGTYVARLSIENESLGYVVWSVDGRTVARRSLDGRTATDRIRLRHGVAGNDEVRAMAYDMEGQWGGASQTVVVERTPATTRGRLSSGGPERGPTTEPSSVGPLARPDGDTPDATSADGPTETTPPGVTPAPADPSVEPAVSLDGASRATWLVRKDPRTPTPEDAGIVIPTGWSPGGGATGAAKLGDESGEQSPEYVNVLSHTTRELAGADTGRAPDSSTVTYVGLGNLTRSGGYG